MSLDGIYDVIVKSPLGDQKSTLTVKTDGSSFIGRNVGATANNEIAGTVEGHTLAWQEKISVPIPMTLDMTATVEGDTLSGTVKAGAFGSFPMTGARAS